MARSRVEENAKKRNYAKSRLPDATGGWPIRGELHLNRGGFSAPRLKGI